MQFQWYNLFNRTAFEALDLNSRTYTVVLDGIGQKDILVTKGVAIGITVETVFLSLNLNDNNPFVFEGYAIYEDANHDVWIGKEIES